VSYSHQAGTEPGGDLGTLGSHSRTLDLEEKSILLVRGTAGGS
jgi:hypothetical protein